MERLREHSYAPSPQNLGGQLEALVERTEDFTDSAYTSHEQRQAILGVCQLVRQDTEQLVRAWVEAVRRHTSRRYNKKKSKQIARETPGKQTLMQQKETLNTVCFSRSASINNSSLNNSQKEFNLVKQRKPAGGVFWPLSAGRLAFRLDRLLKVFVRLLSSLRLFLFPRRPREHCGAAATQLLIS